MIGFNLRPSFLFNGDVSAFTTNEVNYGASEATLFSSKGSYANYLNTDLYINSEKENLSRFSRFTNPILSYDYKCGHYIGI
jgi:hypothetical protein